MKRSKMLSYRIFFTRTGVHFARKCSKAFASLHRVGRRIALTDASLGFLPQAHAILARVAAAQEVLADLPDLERERRAARARQTIASSWLGPLLARFHRLYPRRVLDVAVVNASRVAQAMLKREARLGVVEGKVGEPLPGRAAIPGDSLILVASAGHPRRDRKAVAFADLPALAFLLREAGSGTRQMFESAARVAGIVPEHLRVVLKLPSNEAVRSAVAAGAGVTVISDLVAAAGLAAGTLVRMPFALPPRMFCTLRHAGRYHARAAAALLAPTCDPGAGMLPLPL